MGWRRQKILDPVFQKLKDEGIEFPVKHLAEITGIPAGNLSTINSGKRDMTDTYALRIAEQTGISPAELGSDAGEGEHQALLTLDRLRSLEVAFENERQSRDLEHAALLVRLADLEEALEKAAPGSLRRASGGDPT